MSADLPHGIDWDRMRPSGYVERQHPTDRNRIRVYAKWLNEGRDRPPVFVGELINTTDARWFARDVNKQVVTSGHLRSIVALYAADELKWAPQPAKTTAESDPWSTLPATVPA